MKINIFSVVFSILLVSVSGENLPDARISGGQLAAVSDFPFSVAMLSNAGGTFSQACGGVLLTNNAVLSAASCFYTSNILDPVSKWRARVGSSDGNRGGSVFIIRLITANPGFSPTTLANDIAVLRTTLAIRLVPGTVEVAWLAGAAFTFTTQQQLTAIGYGVTSSSDTSQVAMLRQVSVSVTNQEFCTEWYEEVGVTVTQDMVCVGWQNVGVRGQCQRDTGSPILSGRSVVGIFSRSEGCAQGRFPGINTKTTSYLPWIVATANQIL